MGGDRDGGSRPFSLLAGEMRCVVKCGAGLGTHSVPRIWRCAPEGAAFPVTGPARTCEPAAGQTSARGSTDKPRSCRATPGPWPPPLSQVRSCSDASSNLRVKTNSIPRSSPLLALHKQVHSNRSEGLMARPSGSTRAMGNNMHTVRSGCCKKGLSYQVIKGRNRIMHFLAQDRHTACTTGPNRHRQY